jgi:hypothetical protein
VVLVWFWHGFARFLVWFCYGFDVVLVSCLPKTGWRNGLNTAWQLPGCSSPALASKCVCLRGCQCLSLCLCLCVCVYVCMCVCVYIQRGTYFLLSATACANFSILAGLHCKQPASLYRHLLQPKPVSLLAASGRPVGPSTGFGCSKCRYSEAGCLQCNPAKMLKFAQAVADSKK